MGLLLNTGGIVCATRQTSARWGLARTARMALFGVFALAAWTWTVAGAIAGDAPSQRWADSFARARRPASDPNKADTSAAARNAAVASIPFEKLDPEARRKATSVLSQPALYRRMPLHVMQCDPDMYLFVVRHPDVLVGIWEELGVSEFRMSESGPGTFRAVEGDATCGTAEFLYQDENIHVVYCEGEYRGPLLAKPIRGRALVILRTGYVEEADGRHYITSRLDTFTYVENATVEFLTRTFQPLVGKVVDNNFLQTSTFVGSLSRTTEVNYRGVQRLAGNLHRVRPEVRREFAILAREIGEKGARQASHREPLGEPMPARTASAMEQSRH